MYIKKVKNICNEVCNQKKCITFKQYSISELLLETILYKERFILFYYLQDYCKTRCSVQILKLINIY